MTTPPASICILRLSALGDVSHIVPIVRTLQHHWPNTKITWIIGKLEHTLVGNIAGIEFIVCDKSQGWAANKAVWQHLRGRRFDVLLLMQAALRASVLSLGIRAQLKIGFDRARARDFQWLFSNKKIAACKHQHVLDGFFGFLETLGLQQRVLRWDIPIDNTSMHFAKTWLGDKPILLINPCSSARAHNFRNWRAGRYAAVADYAYTAYGLRTVLTGGPTENEQSMANAIARAAHVELIDLVGKTTIPQLNALVNHAQVVIAPDTGPAHMASAAGTPVIGLYTTSNPGRTGPYNATEWTVNRYPQAVQQYLGKRVENVRWGIRVRHADAVDLISVDDVIEQLNKIMAVG